MKQAALGFRVHSGWCSMVAVAIEEGSPRVLSRSRPLLVRKFTFEYRQPYHSAQKISPAEGRRFISFVRAEARCLARETIRSAQANLRGEDCELARCALLLASGRPLPALPQILASHALIHTADGELFREALLHASKRCGVESFVTKEVVLLEAGSQALGLRAEELPRRLADLGADFGSPWTQDEKYAALAAWLSLVS